MNKINTIIIGAGRSGTTSIFAYLEQHQDVNCSITKEIHYFSIPDLYARGEAYLHSLFNARNKQIIATADTYLLIDAEAPERIKNYNPDMKIIIMLREPVARAYSNFNYSVNFGHEQKGIQFLDTISLEQERLKNCTIVERNNLCHFYGSLYHQHISMWQKYFPAEQIILLELEELKHNPEKVYLKLCSKLGITYQQFAQQNVGFNKATGVKSKWLQQLLLNRDNPLRKMISFVLRPFRKLVIQSGVIDKVYALNKKATDMPPLSEADYTKAAKYFSNDLALLSKDFNINFKH